MADLSRVVDGVSGIVWILEIGAYDSCRIAGVYSTAEAAKAAWHPDKVEPVNYYEQDLRWKWVATPDSPHKWHFDGDYEHIAFITPATLDAFVPPDDE